MRVSNLHTAPKIKIKVRTFPKKIDSYLEKYKSAKFLEILHSNKTPTNFSNHQHKIALKHSNYVREPF